MRNTPLKGMLKASPIRKDYPTKDYSAKATKGNIGDRIAKAVTPTSGVDVLPVGKVAKGAKAIYNYLKE